MKLEVGEIPTLCRNGNVMRQTYGFSHRSSAKADPEGRARCSFPWSDKTKSDTVCKSLEQEQ